MNAPLKTIATEAATDFVRRHIGPSPRDIAAMLETTGAKSLAELMGQTLPASIRQKAPLDLGRGLSETERFEHGVLVGRIRADVPLGEGIVAFERGEGQG